MSITSNLNLSNPTKPVIVMILSCEKKYGRKLAKLLYRKGQGLVTTQISNTANWIGVLGVGNENWIWTPQVYFVASQSSEVIHFCGLFMEFDPRSFKHAYFGSVGKGFFSDGLWDIVQKMHFLNFLSLVIFFV